MHNPRNTNAALRKRLRAYSGRPPNQNKTARPKVEAQLVEIARNILVSNTQGKEISFM
jgi:hypothetical protein